MEPKPELKAGVLGGKRLEVVENGFDWDWPNGDGFVWGWPNGDGFA